MYELKELEERIVSVTEKQKTVAEKIISALEGEKLSLRESFEILDLAKILISRIEIFLAVFNDFFSLSFSSLLVAILWNASLYKSNISSGVLFDRFWFCRYNIANLEEIRLDSLITLILLSTYLANEPVSKL